MLPEFAVGVDGQRCEEVYEKRLLCDGGLWRRAEFLNAERRPICQGERAGRFFFRPSCQPDSGRNDAAQPLERPTTVLGRRDEREERATLSLSQHSARHSFPVAHRRVICPKKPRK